MTAERAGDFRQRFEFRTHRAGRPLVEKPPGPGRADVLPEPLKVLPQQVRPDAPQVVLQELGELDRLLVGEMRRLLEQAPATLGQCAIREPHLLVRTLRGQASGFLNQETGNGECSAG